MKNKIKKPQQGFALLLLLSSIVIFIMIFTSALMIVETNFDVVSRNVKSQQAFNVAEAGINYYLWHLSHSPADFKDGLTTPTTPDPSLGYGPYVHNYIDDNAVITGTYTLWIKPQGGGSSIVTVRSIGNITGSKSNRVVEAQIGSPSYASYAISADTEIWFGNTESANGPVHSNQGVRMDGASNADVTSANTTYTPSLAIGGDGSSHPGVWCSNSVTTPVNCATRSKTSWRYPVPSLDFNQVIGSLCTIKKNAFLANGSTSALALVASPCTQTPTTLTPNYLPQRSTTGTYSATKGYLISLNSDGTYDLFQVNAEDDTKTPYTSALTLVSVANNISVGSSQVIFAEDNVWVRTNGSYSGRITIAAGRLATTVNAEVTIVDNMLYGSKSGADAIGLVSEDAVVLAAYAAPKTGNFTLEVDAAVIAQAGSVTYPLYYRGTTTCTQGWSGASQKLVFYGSIATRQTWTWTWLVGNSPCGNAVNVSGSGYVSGILNNSTQYDYNLQYTPPPSFPLTSSYNILGWREVLSAP